ncbi:MAG: sugar transporter substrate-binding protein, partial [Thermomicrobiales bacterium]|nr:sugar transporter substrate-binding protein [Thermomicrobiales bacterium]
MRDDRLRTLLPRRTDRRTILKGAGATITLAAATPFFQTGAGAATLRQTPTTTDISGTSLRILLWSHFVPLHDVWFDQFVAEWGEANGVTTQVDHVNTAD